MTDADAYHEAGHAFLAVFLGAKVRSVTIEPDRDDLPERFGDAQIAWDLRRFTRRELHEKMVLVALAGPAAEMLYRGEPYHPGLVAEWSADWAAAWEAAAPLIPEEKSRLAFLERATVSVRQTLSQNDCWAALAAIADHLLAHETLEGEEVEVIVSQWMR